jgi:hypothetical protein
VGGAQFEAGEGFEELGVVALSFVLWPRKTSYWKSSGMVSSFSDRGPA